MRMKRSETENKTEATLEANTNYASFSGHYGEKTWRMPRIKSGDYSLTK